MNDQHSTNSLCQLGTKYPRHIGYLRLVIGIWMLVMMMILYTTGHGGGWAWLLSLVAVLHFGLAYRLLRIARRDSVRRVQFR